MPRPWPPPRSFLETSRRQTPWAAGLPGRERRAKQRQHHLLTKVRRQRHRHRLRQARRAGHLRQGPRNRLRERRREGQGAHDRAAGRALRRPDRRQHQAREAQLRGRTDRTGRSRASATPPRSHWTTSTILAGPDAAGSFSLINLDREGRRQRRRLNGRRLDAARVRRVHGHRGIHRGPVGEVQRLARRGRARCAHAQHEQRPPLPDLQDDHGPGLERGVQDSVGWVGFKVTDYDANGSSGKVYGAFTEVIWEGIQSTSGNNTNYGVRAVALIE